MTPQQETRYWTLQHRIDDLQTAIDLLSAYRQYGRGITTPDYYSQMKLLVNSKALTERKQLDLFHPQTAEFNHHQTVKQ